MKSNHIIQSVLLTTWLPWAGVAVFTHNCWYPFYPLQKYPTFVRFGGDESRVKE